MLVVSRKNGQKIMINDDIVITVVESKNGNCKIAIEADRSVKIYREEIYYQIKLANLIGKNTNVSSVDSVSDLIKGGTDLNNTIGSAQNTDEEIIVEEKKPKKTLRVYKNKNENN